MSGIAGIIHFDSAPAEPRLIEKMTSAMSHRGPDGIHHWVKGSVALGQCMLCTTPESLEEHQPLPNEDESLVLVMDGRVDNWEELRRELLSCGARLRDRSDAELVLRAYEVWGRDCLSHIDGDFALVIWDARRRTAFCARDRTGSKPFYYHWSGRALIVASELRAMLSLPLVPHVANRGMLAEFLAAEWYSRDETLWDGIMRLVPACQLDVGPDGPLLARYWQPDIESASAPRDDDEWVECYRALLADSVRRMSRSCKPVACEVSGGLDSSAVFCMAEHLGRLGGLHAPGLAGFTLAFVGDPQANDLDYTRAIGEHLNLRVIEIPPSRMTLSWYAARAETSGNFPGFPNGAMALDLMQQASRRGHRVLLCGLGGDEWLAGSRAYYEEELASWRWASVLGCFQADAEAFGARQAFAWLFRQGVYPLLHRRLQHVVRWLLGRIPSDPFRDTFWLSPEMRQALAERRTCGLDSRSGRSRHTAQHELLQYLEDAYHGFALEMTEAFCSEFQLELRRPLYRADIVRFAFSSPARTRLRGDQNKYTHVRALEGLMPAVVLSRKDKAEFSGVFRWSLEELADTLVRCVAPHRPDWVVPEGMNRLIATYREDPQAHWAMWALWSVFGCASLFHGGVLEPDGRTYTKRVEVRKCPP